jgi:hypothetical protein
VDILDKKDTNTTPVMWSQKRILVMEFISGRRPDDLEFLDANHIDRDEVSAALAHIFNEMVFGDEAPLHCDPHGGNIAIRPNPNRKHPNFDIILYDHGLYRNIDRELRRNYAKLWLAVIDADVPRMREYAYKVAGVTEEQFPLFASAITGRDYSVLTKQTVVSSRTAEEKNDISGALGEGMLQQLVDLLGKVPRIILLILKTNDLSMPLPRIQRYFPLTSSSPQPRRKLAHPPRPHAHLPDSRTVRNAHCLRRADGVYPGVRWHPALLQFLPVSARLGWVPARGAEALCL